MAINTSKEVSGFQTSVNIAYDLNNRDKIQSFIPTSSAVTLLKDIILSTDDSATNRARILIGAYGKGKSHIVLSILSILYHKDASVVASFLAKVKETDPDLYDYVQEYLLSEKRLLPVIISGNSTSLTQAFLRALYSTLQQNKLTDIMPETNFQMALKMIELWRSDYPVVYESLQNSLPMPVESFEAELKDYSAYAYSLFEKMYPQLTAGNEFNPFVGYDVVELYSSVCAKLAVAGYSGLYVVYDEFSKYLESSITKASINDIKMLQDFAEKCSRSGKTQLHLLLISHKEIDNYIDILPKQKVDGWRGVSERFYHFNMQTDYPQTYEILAAAVGMNAPIWSTNNVNRASIEQSLLERYKQSPMFMDCSEEQVRDAVIGCYPLHPAMTFILPRISERVAQNERTLFTFIAAQEPNCLCRLRPAKNRADMLLTPDFLYDYFAPQMRKEVYTSDIHKLYLLTSEILSKIRSDQSLEAKIIKTLSLIYCIGQFNILAPTVETITDIYCDDNTRPEDVLSVIESLIREQLVIYLKRSNGYLQLKRSSGVNIYSEIADTVDKRKSINKPADILNAANVEPYLYPIRYNDEHRMTRYFSFRFIMPDDLMKINDKQIVDADGIVFGIVPDKDQEQKSFNKVMAECFRNSSQIVLAIPDENSGISNELQRFDAVSLLRADASEDEVLANEYEMIYQDLLETINQYIVQYIHPALHSCSYWYMGEQKKIYRKSHLTELLSSICDTVFPNTPIINNEVINRNRISSVALNSRTKILTALMQSSILPNLGFSGSGQEVSFLRSTLILPGILQQTELSAGLNEDISDLKLKNVLCTINDFFDNSKGKQPVSFALLYEALTGKEKGIGIRRGLIPIYIAVAMHKYKNHILIWQDNKEVRITAELLNQINESPESFSVQIEEWTDMKEAYTSGLSQLFQDYIIEKEKQYSTYSYLLLALGRWYLSLPKYTKEAKNEYRDGNYKKIDRTKRDFLSILKQTNAGAQEVLFVKIPKCFGMEEFSLSLLDRIGDVKSFYDGFQNRLEDELISDSNKILIPEHADNSLAVNAELWTDNISPRVKARLFPDGAEQILPILEKPGNNERALINRLAKIVVGLNIEHWNDSSIDQYLKQFQSFVCTINQANQDQQQASSEEAAAQSDHYSVTFIDETGAVKLRTFERTTYSKRAKLLYNMIDSNLNEMGHSVSQEEKRQVLMEILETLC